MTVELVAALLLVLGNGFFVAVEFSVARLRPSQVSEWVGRACSERLRGCKKLRK
jgi:CBS domain containing-hemolysin-like protein